MIYHINQMIVYIMTLPNNLQYDGLRKIQTRRENVMDLSNKNNRIIMFIITYFLGIFGIHWFIQKNYTKGFLYLFSCGGFVVCWIYDVIRCFVNIFSYDPNYLRLKKEKDISHSYALNKPIENNLCEKIDKYYTSSIHTLNSSVPNDYSELSVYNEIRIVKESSYLIDNSKNIDTVIGRLQFIPEHIIYLKRLEKMNLYNVSPSASEYYNDYILLKDMKIQKGIVRCYKDVLDKANELKTEKGRINKINKFFDKLVSYKPMLSSTMNNYIDNFIETRKL